VCLLRGTDWVFIHNSTFCPHSVFMCFVWIWEQTAIISLYSINWLVFITETECLLRGTDWVFIYKAGPVECSSRCQGSGGQSPASHLEVSSSIPGQSMWDLWWTKGHWQVSFPIPQYHSTNVPSSSPSTCLLLQEGETGESCEAQKAVVLEIAENWIDKYFYLVFKGLRLWPRYKTTLQLYSSVTLVTTLRAGRHEVPFPAVTDVL